LNICESNCILLFLCKKMIGWHPRPTYISAPFMEKKKDSEAVEDLVPKQSNIEVAYSMRTKPAAKVGPVSPEKEEVPLVLDSLVNVDDEKHEEPDPGVKIKQVEEEFGICFPKQLPCNYSAAFSSNPATHTVLNHKKKLPKADTRVTVNIV
jgi:hypothetical protein